MTDPPREDDRARTVSFRVEADTDVRLDTLVATQLEISRTQSATLIAGGFVRVASRHEKASYRPRAGETIEAQIPAPRGHTVLPENIPLDVIFEDDELLVVNKAAGMVVHPAPGHWDGTLVNALLGRGGALAVTGAEGRPGLVHRLDKETSGLLVVAKTERSLRVISAAIAARRVFRRYAALVWGHLATDSVMIDRPIGRDPRDRTRMAIVTTGRQARTEFRRLARFQSVDLLRAQLHTGRTHQIRVHLASVGHPVVGDDTYGAGGSRRFTGLPPGRHFLHAAWLRFRHPVTGASMDLRAPLPADLRAALLVAADGELGHGDPLNDFGFFAIDP